MEYCFDIVGVFSILDFLQTPQSDRGHAYISSRECSLDRVLAALTELTHTRAWDYDSLAQITINYWLRQAEAIQRWHHSLSHAGNEGVLVARVAHVPSLRDDLELMLRL